MSSSASDIPPPGFSDRLAAAFPNASNDFWRLNAPKSKENALAGRTGGKKGHSMNKTEAQYALVLEGMKQKGEIAWCGYEKITLRLADRTTYTPDFVVAKAENHLQEDGGCGICYAIRFIEIKGFRRDDAMVKFKVAREQLWWAEFQMVQKTKSGWKQIL